MHDTVSVQQPGLGGSSNLGFEGRPPLRVGQRVNVAGCPLVCEVVENVVSRLRLWPPLLVAAQHTSRPVSTLLLQHSNRNGAGKCKSSASGLRLAAAG